VLERDFSGDIVGHLGKLARLAREEGNFWDALVEDRFQALGRKDSDVVRVAVRDILTPLALQTAGGQNRTSRKCNEFGPLRMLTERLIRRLYEEVRGDRRELGAIHVEQVMHLASGSSSGHHVELPGAITVRRSFGELIFSCVEAAQQRTGNGTAKQAGAYEYILSLPLCGTATVSVPELGKCFRLKVIDWPVTESDTNRDANALDADLLRSPLILRNWRPGDAYRPQGRRHERKLKSMFLAGRIPSGERAAWPVLESGGRVIWSKGMPAAEDFRAKENTRTGFVIEEEGP
jgi:tRNA(Ile)-lysidine synthetase-like protein